jgi:uncharacterized phage protein (possible DNA packaging)
MNGELTLDDVKLFLKLDSDDDDNYVKLLIEVAKEYVTSQIGECNQAKARVRILMLTLIANLYENRQFTVDKNDKVQYVLNIMIAQLQMERDNSA